MILKMHKTLKCEILMIRRYLTKFLDATQEEKLITSVQRFNISKLKIDVDYLYYPND